MTKMTVLVSSCIALLIGCSGSEKQSSATDPATVADAGARDGGESSGVANIDPNDPPVPTEPCGTDLDVHNGTLLPEFNTPKNGGAFKGDPIENGKLSVVLEDHTLKNPDASRNDVSVTAYGPSKDGEKIDAGPFPLIVLLPGFSGNHTLYRHFTDHFVSHGFAVLGITCANVTFTDAPNNPANVAEIQAAIKWALEESSLKGKIDVGRMAVSGHSQGGKLAFFTAATDPRFKIVLGWDPENGGGAPCMIAGLPISMFAGQDCNAWPVAPNCEAKDPGMLASSRAESLVFAARDTAVTPDQHAWAEHFYRGAPSPASLLLFPSAGHGDWGGAGATSDITKRVQMALLLTRFMGKSGLDKYLPDGAYAKGESSVMVYTK